MLFSPSRPPRSILWVVRGILIVINQCSTFCCDDNLPSSISPLSQLVSLPILQPAPTLSLRRPCQLPTVVHTDSKLPRLRHTLSLKVCTYTENKSGVVYSWLLLCAHAVSTMI